MDEFYCLWLFYPFWKLTFAFFSIQVSSLVKVYFFVLEVLVMTESPLVKIIAKVVFLFIYKILHLVTSFNVLHSMPFCDLFISLINGFIVIRYLFIVDSFILILIKPIYSPIIFRLIIHEILTEGLFRDGSLLRGLNMFHLLSSFFPFWRHILHIFLSSGFWHK